MKPGTGGCPIALHGGWSNFHGLSSLLQGESSEEAQFHYAALPGIDFGESIQSIVERYDVHVFSPGRHRHRLQRELAGIAAAFPCRVAAGIVDENLAHEVSGNREEMGAALPLRRLEPDHAQVSLMHERGTLQGVAGPLPLQLRVREATQFSIDKGQQDIECVAVSVPPPLQK
jgi:hypothetical protein